MLNNISIGLFIDGGYYSKAYNDADKKNYDLKISNVMKFCIKYLSYYYNLDERDCQIIEKHYYRGRFTAKDVRNPHGERVVEDSLIEEDVVFHYKHMTIKNEVGKEKKVIEKGIDVWFALETYEISIARDLDIVVIFTGDGDHEMLLNKIKALKKKAVLLTWNNLDGEGNNVSKLLREEATLHIDINKEIESEQKDRYEFLSRCNV